MTSFQSYTATAGQTQFAIPFRFILEAFVKVDVDGTELALDTDYTLTGSSISDGVYSGGSVELVTPAVGGETVKVYRDSGIEDVSRLVDFEAGSRLKASDLDRSAIQLLHLIQEVKDNSATAEDMTITIADVVGLQSALDGKAANSVFAEGANGIVPGPNANQIANQYVLAADGTWIQQASGGGSGGSSTFVGLTDTPTTLSGYGGQFLRVASDPADGLEFATATTDLGDLLDVSYGGLSQPNDGDALVYSGTGTEWRLSPSLSVDHTSNQLYQTGTMLVVDSGGDYTALPVPASSDGKVLTINSAATNGQSVEWQTPSGGGLSGYFFAQGVTGSDLVYEDGGNVSWDAATVNQGGRFNLAGGRTGNNWTAFGGILHSTIIGNSCLKVQAAGNYLFRCTYCIKNTSTTTAYRFVLNPMHMDVAGGSNVFVAFNPRGETYIQPGETATISVSFMKAMGNQDQITFYMFGSDESGSATAGYGNIEIQQNRATLEAMALS
jgi:hypothetical protein